MRIQFSLVAEPWEQVVRGGLPVEVSLSDALGAAHEIDDLDWGDPPGAAASLGFLVAVTKDAVGIKSGAEWIECWKAGQLPREQVQRYLDEHADRLDLFHAEHPFYQVSGLEPVSGGPKPVALLVGEQATGNNVPLFSSSTEAAAPPLTPAEAARRVVTCQAWNPAAIKTGAQGDPHVKNGKTTGNPTGPLGQLGVVYLIGTSLFETIMLNLPVGPAKDGDVVAWRRSWDATWGRRAASGTLDLYTWQSRRICLFPEEIDGRLAVTGVLVCAGDRLETPSPESEPRSGWRRGKDDAGAAVIRPQRHQSGRSAWRGLASLVTESAAGTDEIIPPGVIRQLAQLRAADALPTARPVQVQLVGVEYGNMSAVIENVISDRTPLPLAALEQGRVRDWISEMSAQADQVAAALNSLADNLRRAVGGDKIPWDKGHRTGDAFLRSLAAEAARVLSAIARESHRVDAAALAWEQTLRRHAWRHAEPLLTNAPPETFLGHGDPPIRQSNAEAFFRSALNKALPATAQHGPRSRDKEATS